MNVKKIRQKLINARFRILFGGRVEIDHPEWISWLIRAEIAYRWRKLYFLFWSIVTPRYLKWADRHNTVINPVYFEKKGLFNVKGWIAMGED